MGRLIGLDCREQRWSIKCESLELKHADPRDRAAFGIWRLPGAIEETPRHHDRLF